MDPPERIRSSRRGLEWLKSRENEPVDRAIQYLGETPLTLRAKLPLKPIIAFEEAENSDLEVPFFKYDPRVLCTDVDYRHGVNLPGNYLEIYFLLISEWIYSMFISCFLIVYVEHPK